MSRTGTRGGSTGRTPGEGSAPAAQERLLPWLLRQKVSVPDRVAGYLDRAALVDRVTPTRQRLTVLIAPGGFGKTTLLAECCRRLREDGVRVAWVSVDEQDEPAVLDTYIAYACQSAVASAVEGPERPAEPGADNAPGGSGSRTALAMHEVASLEVPFVLVFDEVERLGNPESAALLGFLIKRGPPNLHLAFACRQLPVGVDVASLTLDGRAVMVSAEDLRFSTSEVAEFFDRKLTRGQLTALMSESAGWPFALRISRNELDSGGRADARAAQEIVENWVESRLFAGLGAEDREFSPRYRSAGVDGRGAPRRGPRAKRLAATDQDHVRSGGHARAGPERRHGCLAPASVDPRALLETAFQGDTGTLSAPSTGGSRTRSREGARPQPRCGTRSTRGNQRLRATSSNAPAGCGCTRRKALWSSRLQMRS